MFFWHAVLSNLVGNVSFGFPEARVIHLANYCLPKSKKDLKSLIGLSSYYRRFIHSLANYTAILLLNYLFLFSADNSVELNLTILFQKKSPMLDETWHLHSNFLSLPISNCEVVIVELECKAHEPFV